MSKIKVIETRCTGCGQCIKVCPADCITLRPREGKYPKTASIDEAKCVFCKACRETCAKLQGENKDIFNAVEIAQKRGGGSLKDYKGVWCFAEVMHGALAPSAYELLYIGKQLAADLGEPLCAVLLGREAEKFSGELIKRGAKTVYVCEHPALENFIDDVYSKCLVDIVHKYKPNKFLLPASTIGRSVAAKAAITLNTGLTADATEAVIDKNEGLLLATRPTFGGNLMATIVCRDSRPEMCTIRPLTYPKAAPDDSLAGEVVRFDFDPARHNSKAKFVSFVREEADEIDIGAADVIVAGGRGVGKPEGFAALKELAHLLNGAVGASRAAVDSGWIGYRHQIGLTGRTVKPKVYIACGISGQIQHLAGMSSSDVIVAVNKDPDAPLMQQASYSVEADLYEFIPALAEELKKGK